MEKNKIHEIFRKYKSENEIFHDLMPVRMREILLVATIYDAFTLEQDGLISEMIFTEFYQLNLFHAPRITSASSDDEALEKLSTRHFDLVIIISRIHRADSCELSKRIKSGFPNMPVLLLLNDNAGIGALARNDELRRHFDSVFVWNGNCEIFLAMVKYIEDKINVFNDTRIGHVRVILLVEDSLRYYSRYLPLLYTEIMKQTQRLVSEEQSDELKKVLRRRARPKVLLASTYEEAISVIENFRDYLLCVISDVSYPRDGKMQEDAGIRLIGELKKMNPDLPVLLQSSDPGNEDIARTLGAGFVHKDSERLARNLTNFFYQNLGFGDFIFRAEDGREIGRAKTLEDLKSKLNQVPASSIRYHASRNHFSAWLMARGEIQIARVVYKAKVDDFGNAEELRTFLISVGEYIKVLKTKGKVIPFDETFISGENQIFRLSEGSLGGKGRGIAFVNSLLTNSELSEQIADVHIKIPRTAVIGIDEFSVFLDRNNLLPLIQEEADFETLKRRFLMGSFSPELTERLRRFLEHFTSPLAIRSSGLLEDSLSHPLSGLYQTFFLPNNHPEATIRLNQLQEAIKLVYASVYTRTARAYFDAIDYQIEEERMAVVIQEVVGRSFGNFFYPHVSGVAQSYNFYPFSYIKPEDGVAMAAVGLGKYVVEGEQAFRFCPEYPKLDILTPENLMKASQKHFYALDLTKNTVDLFNGEYTTLRRLEISQAEADGVMAHCGSVWDFRDQCFRPGVQAQGPRVVNFGNILKYESFPLPKVLKLILEIINTSMETPAEIEFAVDLEPGAGGKPTFYLLQIKHLLRNDEQCSVSLDHVNPRDVLLYSDRGMGNGINRDLTDIVWVDPAVFDKMRTPEMGSEIEALNEKLKQQGRHYVLLGPGRWGTRDRWLGIPIDWPQISHARVIVEYGLEDFLVEASQGSHFFHNVTSMNIGYFTVPYQSPPCFIDWNWLRTLEVVEHTGFFVHSRVPEPLRIVMDGRRSVSVIFKHSTATPEDTPVEPLAGALPLRNTETEIILPNYGSGE
jgi:CheY-like chemotaxis protein